MTNEPILQRTDKGVYAPAQGEVEFSKKAGMEILMSFAAVAHEEPWQEVQEKAQTAVASGNIEDLFEVLRYLYENGMPGSYLQGPAFRKNGNKIRWDGTWTTNRFVEVEFVDDKSIVRWDSGTGKPSGYIGDQLQGTIGFF